MLNYILIWQPAAFLVLLPLLSLFTFRRLPTRVLNLIRVLIYVMDAAACWPTGANPCRTARARRWIR